MKQQLKHWEIAGFFFTCIVGTLLHFFYEFTGKHPIAALFSPVNESTWEHLKLLVIPLLLFSLLEVRVLGDTYPNFWAGKLAAVLVGMFSITALFYTYSGALGRHSLLADIVIFFVSVFIAYYVSYRVIASPKPFIIGSHLSIVLILFILGLFAFFTFNPPQIPLFLSP